jgi:hypothetical protein
MGFCFIFITFLTPKTRLNIFIDGYFASLKKLSTIIRLIAYLLALQ